MPATNFDIIVNAREFSEEFDLLCAETLGLVSPPDGGPRVPYNKAVDRVDIRPAIEKTLAHLCSLLGKADVVTDRYELKDDSQAVQQTSFKGLVIFRERFEASKDRIRTNQKDNSTWKVTRWAVHDFDRFKASIDKIMSLVDGLESITSALGVLEQQRALPAEEVECYFGHEESAATPKCGIFESTLLFVQGRVRRSKPPLEPHGTLFSIKRCHLVIGIGQPRKSVVPHGAVTHRKIYIGAAAASSIEWAHPR
ncbi:hypothetical protein B0H63DRAFT_531159 [Podospora didyma]|uniref:Prion-inhibition and propagation HeLo domain-containing protein n=1 Tax=Podospora didyma TaxID=330526 RepID=A0AAE0U735_9PEZI|nr:hypothetical protein B0H63DRAFT_531159 [Podospora didyma]